MEQLLAPQIEWVIALQQHTTPALDAFFRTFTDFGGRYYMWLVPAVVWCVDRRTGTRVLVLMALTLFLNAALKAWLAQPRPFQLDERVISASEDGYGLPSGHAQLVVVFWGRDRGLGGLTLWAYLRWRGPAEAWLAGLPRPALVALAVGVALLVFDRLLVGDDHFLAAGSAGFLAGAGIGAALAWRRLDFSGHGVWWRRLLRYPLGMVLTLPLLGVMQRLGLPEGPAASGFVFLDLALFAFWIGFALPWLFGRVRLGDAPVR